ncbi:MAG: helix-turn-helix domain-containing protein, partial [Bryobacteraceae bacterium]
MPSVGQLLRDEREKQNRSLEELAGATRIKSRYLQAIESDNIPALPGEFFYRSFVRQYAGALGIDPASLDEEVNRLVPLQDIDPLPALSTAYNVARIEGRIRTFPSNRAGWSVALLFAVLVGCSGLYGLWQRYAADSDLPPEAAALIASQKAASQKAASQQAASKKSPQAAEERPEIPAADLETPPPAPPPTEIASVRPPLPLRTERVLVDLAATKSTWVSLSSDGKVVFSGTLSPGDTRSLEGSESAKLLTGNADGLDVRWNGKAIGRIGRRGQVKLVVF